MNEPLNLWSEEQEDWVNRVQRARCTIAQLCSIKVVSAIKTSLLFNCRFLPEGRGGLGEETTIINIHFLKNKNPPQVAAVGNPQITRLVIVSILADCFVQDWCMVQQCSFVLVAMNCKTAAHLSSAGELHQKTAWRRRSAAGFAFLLLLECDVYEILQRPGFARQSWSHCLSCCTAVLVTSKIGKLQTTHSVRVRAREREQSAIIK